MKIKILVAALLCSFNICRAQTYFEIFTGYQKDLNNGGHNFNMINSGIQLRLKKNRTYEMMLMLQKDWGITSNSIEPAYTANPASPLQSTAEKRITPSFASFLLGNKFVFTGRNFPGSIGFLLYGGFAYQKLKVIYQYDKNNYTLLNPDRTQDGAGVFFLLGIEYIKEIKNGRLFFQVLTGPQPLMKNIPSNMSFNFMAPLSLNAGYSFIIKKYK